MLSCKDPRFMSSIFFSICYLNSKLLHAPPGFLMFLGAAKIQDMKNPAETALRVSQLDLSYIICIYIHRIIIYHIYTNIYIYLLNLLNILIYAYMFKTSICRCSSFHLTSPPNASRPVPFPTPCPSSAIPPC